MNEALALWDITRKDVLVACWYAGAYGTVYLWPGNDDDENDDLSSPGGYRENPVEQAWLDRWREWAQEAAKSFWRGEYDQVPDPPSESSGEPPVPERTC